MYKQIQLPPFDQPEPHIHASNDRFIKSQTLGKISLSGLRIIFYFSRESSWLITVIKVQYKVYVFVVEHSLRWSPLQDILKLGPTMYKKRKFFKVFSENVAPFNRYFDWNVSCLVQNKVYLFFIIIKDGQHCWKKNYSPQWENLKISSSQKSQTLYIDDNLDNKQIPCNLKLCQWYMLQWASSLHPHLLLCQK